MTCIRLTYPSFWSFVEDDYSELISVTWPLYKELMLAVAAEARAIIAGVSDAAIVEPFNFVMVKGVNILRLQRGYLRTMDSTVCCVCAASWVVYWTQRRLISEVLQVVLLRLLLLLLVQLSASPPPPLNTLDCGCWPQMICFVDFSRYSSLWLCLWPLHLVMVKGANILRLQRGYLRTMESTVCCVRRLQHLKRWQCRVMASVGAFNLTRWRYTPTKMNLNVRLWPAVSQFVVAEDYNIVTRIIMLAVTTLFHQIKWMCSRRP